VPKSGKTRELENVHLVCEDCAAGTHAAPDGTKPPRTTRQRSDEIGKAAQSLVSRLYEDVIHESCVIFVGSGCTTEGRGLEWSTFYNEIKEKSGYPSSAQSPSFPDLMEYFCQHMDGGQHNRLIREAVSRIERFCVPGDENYAATMFGEELARMPYFNRFVTTNWDPFLERSLEMLIPMIEDRDLGFWDDRKRQVLKIHGCITRPHSIVATTTDYENCLRESPLIFNKLKDLMATKTFVFVGYSLRDPDFRQIWEGITKSLGRFAKLAYGVDPNASDDDIDYWRTRGIEIFKTSDLAFVRCLRARMVKDDLVPSEQFLEFLHRERSRITNIHLSLSQMSDGGFASAMYQDGVLHGLTDALTSMGLGTKKKESFERDLFEAETILKKMWKQKDPVEIAYWTGRTEAIETFCSRKIQQIPAYIHPYKLMPAARFVKGKAGG
jgi:SIR2-like protein